MEPRVLSTAPAQEQEGNVIADHSPCELYRSLVPFGYALGVTRELLQYMRDNGFRLSGPAPGMQGDGSRAEAL